MPDLQGARDNVCRATLREIATDTLAGGYGVLRIGVLDAGSVELIEKNGVGAIGMRRCGQRDRRRGTRGKQQPS